MSVSYYIDRNHKNLKKLNELLDEMPSFCSIFFIGIQNNTTPLTRLNYARDLKLFFKYLTDFEPMFRKDIKDLSIDDIDKIDSLLIERFLSYISFYDDEKGVVYTNSDKGKARKLASVRAFLAYFFEKNYITANVGAKVKTPKIHSKDIIRLESDEVNTMLETTETLAGFSSHQQKYLANYNTRDNAIITLFLGTGIRVSECVGLNVEDIDFNSKCFKVTRKGGNQVILYLSDEIISSLRKYISFRSTLGLPDDERALFVSSQKRRMSVRAMENLVKKYAFISSPLKKISPHKLRSTYGTNLYRATKDIYVVADVLGHKDVNTTKKHYAAISEDIRKDAANKVKLRNTDDDA